MKNINQLVKFSGNKIVALNVLDQETLKTIDKAEEDLYNFDQDFRLLQCVLDNHESFESELKNSLLNGASSDQNLIGFVDFSKIIRIIDKWLLNILSSFKAMIEHLETRIKRNYGNSSKEYKLLKSLLSYEYDNEFSYAFSYKLRNYIQHCGMPKVVFNISQNMENPNEIQLSLELDLHRDELLNSYDSWTTVKERLMQQEEKLCLLNILEELMSSLIRIFIGIKELISFEKAKQAHLLILNIISENETYRGQNYGVCTLMERSGEKLNINTRILKTILFDSLNSFNELIKVWSLRTNKPLSSKNNYLN